MVGPFIYDIRSIRLKLKPLIEQFITVNNGVYDAEDILHFWLVDTLEESRLLISEQANTASIDLKVLMFLKGLPATIQAELQSLAFDAFRVLWTTESPVASKIVLNTLIIEVSSE